jgi:hypothetical protein
MPSANGDAARPIAAAATRLRLDGSGNAASRQIDRICNETL